MLGSLEVEFGQSSFASGSATAVCPPRVVTRGLVGGAARVLKGRSMKGAVWQRSARDPQSRISFPSRFVSPHRGPNDQKVFASAERNYQRYSALAREASLRGDMVAMENFYQHAEHYFRVMRTTSGSDG